MLLGTKLRAGRFRSTFSVHKTRHYPSHPNAAPTSLNAVFLRVVSERAITDLEEVRRLCAHPIGLLQRHPKVTALRVGDLFLEIQTLWGDFNFGACRHTRQGYSRRTGDAVGQNPQGNLPPRLQGNRAFHGVLKLADISRPIVGFQARHGLGRDALNRFYHGVPKTFEKMPCQERNVVPALAQSRHVDRDHAEPIIQVFPETAFRNLLFKFFVCGGNDADIHIRFFGAADWAHLAFLQDSIELHLHGKAHIADLIEEKRAAMGRLEKALPDFVSAGESSLHVTEQFRLQESLWERTAVNGDEGSLGPNAVLMNGAGHPFLARPALPRDKNTARLRGNGLNHVEDCAHLRALPDDVVQARKAAYLPPQITGFLLPF